MIERQHILDLIFEAYAEVKKENLGSIRARLSDHTALVGAESELDSVDLINVVMTLEKKMKAKFHLSARLMGEKLLIRRKDPFEKIGTLAEYLMELAMETVPRE